MKRTDNGQKNVDYLISLIVFLFNSWVIGINNYSHISKKNIKWRLCCIAVIYFLIIFCGHSLIHVSRFFPYPYYIYLASPPSLLLIIDVIFTNFVFCLLGWPEEQMRNTYLGHFKSTGLINPNGYPPMIDRISNKENGDLSIELGIRGIDPNKFEETKELLNTYFNYSSMNFLKTDLPSKIILSLSNHKIPKNVKFDEIIPLLTAPYSFCIGKTETKTIIHPLTKIPHILIAGATQSGKSVMLKQILAGLIHSSNHLQIFGIDMKGGVELNDFLGFPNFKICTEIEDCVVLLKKIELEMKRRQTWMAQNRIKLLDPYQCNDDLIIVVVDEASVLYSLVPKKDEQYSLINAARTSTVNISKLGRAMGIHLILATQKVSNDSIDTRIQENLDGRISFKSNTPEGSSRALGSSKATKLPEIRGRGYWKYGMSEILFQAPYISEQDIDKLKEDELKKFELGEKSIRPIPSFIIKTSKYKDLHKLGATKEDKNE